MGVHPGASTAGAGEPAGKRIISQAVVVATLFHVKLTEKAVKLFEEKAVGLKQAAKVVKALGPAQVLNPSLIPQSERT